MVSGNFGPLFVRGWYWQAASRYNLGATHGTALTSPSDTFREVNSGHRGTPDINMGHRMGKPRSDGRRVIEIIGRYDSGAGNKQLYFLKCAPGRDFGNQREYGFFQCFLCSMRITTELWIRGKSGSIDVYCK